MKLISLDFSSLWIISKIERIENRTLWEKFCVHRNYFKRKNGETNINEDWFFHGTKSINSHKILSHGFNRSFCRDTVLYGRGVYFSSSSAYSCNYVEKANVSFIFLTRVLVGFHTLGSCGLVEPPMITRPDGKRQVADSTTNGSNPPTIVCSFHDDQTYPEYIITFQHGYHVKKL